MDRLNDDGIFNGGTTSAFERNEEKVLPDLSQNRLKSSNYNMENDIFNTVDIWNNDSPNGMQESLQKDGGSANKSSGLELDLGNIMLETHNLDSTKWNTDKYTQDSAGINDNSYDWKYFVFDEREIGSMLRLFVQEFRPDRPSLRLAPAKLFYLASRFAYSYMPKSKNIGHDLLTGFLDSVHQVIQTNTEDMVLCVMWLANVCLLVFYLQRDTRLEELTGQIQHECYQLISEIYFLVCKDAIRRMDEHLEKGMLKYTGIQGLDSILHSRSWNFLRRRHITDNPLSPRSTPSASPRNITKIIASTLHLLEVFYVHPLIRIQCIEQLYHWLGMRLFNRVLSTKKYHSRAAAMEIRFNISSLEEWSQTNSVKLKKPIDYPGEDFRVSLTPHLTSLTHLLQWLQCLYRLSEENEPEALQETLESLDALNPRQFLTVAKSYQPNNSEAKVSRTFLKRLEVYHREELRKTLESAHDDGVVNEFELTKDENQLQPLNLPTKAQLANAYSSITSGNAFNNDRKVLFQPHVSNDIIDRLEENGISMDRAELPTSVFEDELAKREWRPDQEVEELMGA
ncbi:Golgi Ras-interacting protein with DIL domain [Schizosaccharomyces osmophilus]|uniref:Golgi Ras-interacting protein with DIL domain n=1 Tax=Schizosaccharomyces osmophilus TaxID=2545709 RepID=A0AAE9WGC8_9SCHI|nr:Golgi Ras-interacting protein with DIL domain [Schizosaccharomyces osmophilus]WBW75385.1 Golgi Ras-interacting protein with DIL domain [Schizosaccharomyces osmophilus]